MSILKQIEEELERFECLEIINTNQKVYATGRSRFMADKEFLQVIRPWTEENLNNFLEYNGYERKFDKSDLGIACYISKNQLRKEK